MDFAKNALQTMQSAVQTRSISGRAEADKRMQQLMQQAMQQAKTSDALSSPQGIKTEDEGYIAAQQLIATTFFQPMLDQMMDSPLKSDFLDGGSAERIFKQQWHTHLADDVVKSAARFDADTGKWSSPGLPLVDRVYDQITRSAHQEETA